MFELSNHLIVSLVCLILYRIYRWATQNHDHFERKGIAALKPLPFVGNTITLYLKTTELIDFAQKLYDDFPGEKYECPIKEWVTQCIISVKIMVM